MDPQNSIPPTPPANNPQSNLPSYGSEPQPATPPTGPAPTPSTNYTPPGTIEPLESGSLSPQSEIPVAPAQPASQLSPVEPSLDSAVVPPSNPQGMPIAVPPAVEKPKSKTGLIIGIVVAVVVVPVVLLLLMIVVLAVQGAQKAKRDTATKDAALSDTTTKSTTTATGSVADTQLTEDIIKYIYISETSKGNTATDITVDSVKLVSQTSKQTIEEWTLTAGTTKVVYTVTISPTADGGADFGVLKKS